MIVFIILGALVVFVVLCVRGTFATKEYKQDELAQRIRFKELSLVAQGALVDYAPAPAGYEKVWTLVTDSDGRNDISSKLVKTHEKRLVMPDFATISPDGMPQAIVPVEWMTQKRASVFDGYSRAHLKQFSGDHPCDPSCPTCKQTEFKTLPVGFGKGWERYYRRLDKPGPTW